MNHTLECFIQLEGIDGECKQSKHKDWIDVLNYSYALEQSTAVQSGGGSGVGKAKFAPLTFTHFVDKASPNLLKYCAAGKHIPKVILVASKAGDGSQEFMRITLTQVLIVGVSPSGGSNGQAVENVGLSYATIEVKVKEQKHDGSMGPEITGAWDIKANKEI